MIKSSILVRVWELEGVSVCVRVRACKAVLVWVVCVWVCVVCKYVSELEGVREYEYEWCVCVYPTKLLSC